MTSDFFVSLTQNPFALGAGGISAGIALNVASNFLYDIVKRTIDRNLGNDVVPASLELQELEARRSGDLEALVAAVEPAIQQSHMVVDNGAQIINISGGENSIAVYNSRSKQYVNQTIEEKEIRAKDLSVASFNANSGYGSVYDADMGRTVPIRVNKETLFRTRAILSWGLLEYSRGTGRKISLKYYRMLAMDGTPKKYIVVDAAQPAD